jgi:hypothetical protein
MPRIAVLEPDPIIALDIAKSIERGGSRGWTSSMRSTEFSAVREGRL